MSFTSATTETIQELTDALNQVCEKKALDNIRLTGCWLWRCWSSSVLLLCYADYMLHSTHCTTYSFCFLMLNSLQSVYHTDFQWCISSRSLSNSVRCIVDRISTKLCHKFLLKLLSNWITQIIWLIISAPLVTSLFSPHFEGDSYPDLRSFWQCMSTM